MNIEEKAIEVLKYCKERSFSEFNKIYFDDGTNMCMFQAIETLLTAYEKEKEERERVGKLYYEANENCIKYEKMIEKEKEKNKDLKEGYKIQEHNYQVAMEEIEQRWKDKIIAKVIEIKDKPVEDEFITATQGKLNTIIDIEKLLDEEE